MRMPGAGDRDTQNFVAAEDASRLIEQAAALDSAVGVEWYQHHGSEVDRAAAISASYAGQGRARGARRSRGRGARRAPTW